ncbi:hypothetical protein [Lentzea flava]|uniref:Uncharacterized protein n=1 Tax=Lentzea flava TaxID=103732 RepID=A0ABQ2V8F3_9PSEU|nr:hypothetical protein [Lentzea flava]MCP2204033.1 hypothetical protein [Lentzea flava]GGU73839.1 hypothetical protein GCM10010178_76600 [Lentzea flava]
MSEPTAFSPDDTTRYLCVAARTDERFAERMTKALLNDDLHAVAPSVGFSLRPVLLHALAGVRQRRMRDWCLLVATALALILSPLWTLLALLVILPVGGGLARRAGESRRLRDVVFALGALAILLLLSVSIVSALGVAPEPTRRSPAPEPPVAEWLVGVPWLALLTGLVMYGLVVWSEWQTRQTLLGELTRAAFRPDEAPPLPSGQAWLSDRLAAIDEAERGNVTIYSGFTPFIGHGPLVSTWSFALPLQRRDAAEDEESVVRLDTVDLVTHVRDRLAGIGVEPDELPGLLLAERAFVSGNALTMHPALLPERDQTPRQHLAGEDLARLAARPHGSARHYLCAQVPSWGGEVVASTFLHFSTDGRLLHLQCDRTVLGPLWRQYHDVDRISPVLTAGAIGRLLARAASGLASAVPRAPARVLRDATFHWRCQRHRAVERAIALQDLSYDYGARFSVREQATDANYHNYFQKTDAAKHLKLIERHVLAALLDFLDEHGVDTTEFRNRQMTILNQGIIQTGGVSNIGNQAVGQNARAVSHGLSFTAAPANTELMTQLMALLERHSAEVPEETVEVAEELQDELDAPEPDRGVIARMLERLTNLVKPVAPLVEAVGELTKSVNSAFGE